MKFIVFGCWNKDKCNIDTSYPLQGVSSVINSLKNEQSIEKIFVAGDNYYPKKKKFKYDNG